MDVFDRSVSALHNAGQEWSFSSIDDVTRYEVRGGDNWSGQPTERSESASYVQWAAKQTIDISYRVMVEPGEANKAQWLLLNQFFANPGPGGNSWSPPFAIEMHGETMRIVVRGSTDAVIKSNPVGTVIWKDIAPIERGHWYDMDIKIVFDPHGNGSVFVSRDGVELVSYKGPLGYVDSSSYYWKEGIYRSPTDQITAARYSDLDIDYSYVPDDGPVNIINGASGADRLWGTGQNDIIRGLRGDDKLYGHGGDDMLEGGDGADILAGMDGADILNGGPGSDTADYSLSTAGISAHLDGSPNTLGHAEGDILISIEKIFGSQFDDVLVGADGWNYLRGDVGNDLLDGGAGADTLDGGDGNDTIIYARSSAGVTISLLDDKAKGGHAEGDLLIGIENVEGSEFNDILTGDGGANTLSGGGGRDVLFGGEGADRLVGVDGNDILIGGKGDDIAVGGAGSDSFIFMGSSKDYAFSFTDDGRLQVRDTVAGRDGTDLLDGIDHLAFKDGTVNVADVSTEQITKRFDTNWMIVGYDITVTKGNTVQHKHYDANWKILSSERITTEDGTVTTRTYDSDWKQTSVKMEVETDKGAEVTDFDGPFSTKLDSDTRDSPSETTQKVVVSGGRQTTTTYDENGKKIAVDVQTIEASNTVVKHYDGNMQWISNTIYVDRGTSTDIKQYDTNWKLTSYINVGDDKVKLGGLYEDSGTLTDYPAIVTALQQGGGSDYLAGLTHLSHWDLY